MQVIESEVSDHMRLPTSPEGPDLDRPDQVFRDGDSHWAVNVVPALLPMGFVQGTSADDPTTALLAFFFLLLSAILAPFDRRYKTVVSRRTLRHGFWPRMIAFLPALARGPWKVVHVEFFANGESAVRRQLEILRKWDLGELAKLPAMSRLELRAARRVGISARDRSGPDRGTNSA